MAVSYLDKSGLSYFWGKVKALVNPKANKSEMSVTDGTGADADKTTIQLKDGTSATVLKSHQDISGKVDKVQGKGLSTEDYTTEEKGKLGDLPTNSELTSALGNKADKDTDAVEGNVSVFDANGNPVDSGAALNAILSAIQLLASGPQYNPSSQSVVFPVSSSAQYNASARSVSFSTLNV